MIASRPKITYVHTRETSDFWPVAKNADLNVPFSYRGFTGFDSRIRGNSYNSGLYTTVLSSDQLFVSERLVVVGSLDAAKAIAATRHMDFDYISLVDANNQVTKVSPLELGGTYE